METSQLTKCTRNTVASEMTYIVSGGAYIKLYSFTHAPKHWPFRIQWKTMERPRRCTRS